LGRKGLFFNSVKITIVICSTIIVVAILFLSYKEYINRYSLIPGKDDHIFVLDKKTKMLNYCDSEKCNMVELQLPETHSFSSAGFSQSKLFSTKRDMTEETAGSSIIKGVETQNRQSQNTSSIQVETTSSKETKIEQTTKPPDKPKTDKQTAEEPKVDEPKAEEPKVDEPKAEEQKTDKQKAEEPKADEPKAEEKVQGGKDPMEPPTPERPLIEAK
jgi:flagellar biosynthesis GTPase FlhF